ncbi:hypothetical protein ACQJBY_024506 [Aegilops geniculata]
MGRWARARTAITTPSSAATTGSTTTTTVRREGGRGEHRICLLEHGQDGDVVGELSLEEDEGAHLYADEALLESTGQESSEFCADELLHETVEERSHLYNDDELPESPIAGYGLKEGGSDDDGAGSGSDMVYMIDKVHQRCVSSCSQVRGDVRR